MILGCFGYQFRFPGLISCPRLVPNRSGMEFQAYSDFITLKVDLVCQHVLELQESIWILIKIAFRLYYRDTAIFILSSGLDLYAIRKSGQSQNFYVIFHILEDKFISWPRGHRSNPDTRESMRTSFEYKDFLFWNKNLNIESY